MVRSGPMVVTEIRSQGSLQMPRVEGGALGITQPQPQWQLRHQKTVLRGQRFVLQLLVPITYASSRTHFLFLMLTAYLTLATGRFNFLAFRAYAGADLLVFSEWILLIGFSSDRLSFAAVILITSLVGRNTQGESSAYVGWANS